MNVFKKVRDSYVIWHANQIKIPVFDPSDLVRKRVTFSGKVQKVGFRLELYQLAQRLTLYGWVRNLEDGSVETELQGEENRVDFLIKSMNALKRASVKETVIENRSLENNEKDFTILR